MGALVKHVGQRRFFTAATYCGKTVSTHIKQRRECDPEAFFGAQIAMHIGLMCGVWNGKKKER